MKKILLFILLMVLSFVTVNAKAINFSIEDAKVIEKSGAIEVVDPAFSYKEIISSITFKELNDYVVYNVVLKNKEKTTYNLVKVEDNNSNSNISVSYEYDKETIESNDTVSINIKVKYTSLVKNVEKIDVKDFNVILVLESNGKSEEVIINPKTNDNIFLYVLMIVISLVGIVLVLRNAKSRKLLLVLLLGLPLFVLGVQQFKVNISFKDIEIIGKFDIFDVVIDDGSGSEETRNIKYGDTVGVLETPSKIGYIFSGWYDKNGNKVDEDTVITKDLSISAKYEIINYNITYNLNGGTASNVSTYTVEDEVVLNNPTKAGYTFSGWTEGNDDTLRTSMTIQKGSTGDKEFTAHFSTNQDTVYKVIHKQMNMNGEYEETLVEVLHGATDISVTPQPKSYEGFKIPEEQTVNINGDGSTVVTYLYERLKFNFKVNNRDYVETQTSDGKYYYGTSITLEAKDKLGYAFTKWSNNDTNNPITFTLSSDLTIEPVYTANTNTPYKVIHKKMNLYGTDYDLDEEMNLTGTTDSTIKPAVKTFAGFTSPEEQTVTIKADGSTVVTYLYTRNKYTLTINNRDYVETDLENGEYYYGTAVIVAAKNRPGYTFIKWSNNNTSSTLSFLLINDTTLEPIYSPNNNTPYKVIHKTMNLDGESYSMIEKTNAIGTTDTSVTPPVKHIYGFTSPSEQTVNIDGDGSTEIVYLYTRNKYTLTVNSRNYVDTIFTDGEYFYETSITLNAKDRPGYTFTKWSNNNTNKNYILSLVEDITIEPIYTPNTNTPYKVVHKTMNTDGETYTTIEELDLTGTTDTSVTPEVKTIYGFTSPEEQTVNIDGDGSTEVVYLYTRNKYMLTITNPNDVLPEGASKKYYYETEVTLTAKYKTGYTFNKWSTNETTNEITITMDADKTVEALYTAHKYTIAFNANEGTGTMDNLEVDYDQSVSLTQNAFTREKYNFAGWNTEANGSGNSYEDEASVKNLTSTDGATVTLYAKWDRIMEHEEYDEETFDGTNYIDTGIQLFNEDNYRRNFVISVNISDFDASMFDTKTYSGTVFNSIYETSPWPGIAFRINNKKWELKGTSNADNKVTLTFNKETVHSIKVMRIDRKIYYSINGFNPILLIDMSDFNTPFDIPLAFGASVQENGALYDASNRNFKGTLTDMEVRFLPDSATIDDFSRVVDYEEVYRHDGDLVFDGSCDDVIEPRHEDNSLVQLFKSDTYLKDFEISFKVKSYDYEEQETQATLINSKYENNSVGYPGFTLRAADNTPDLQLVATRNTNSERQQVYLTSTASTTITLARREGVLVYSTNGGTENVLMDYNTFTNFFDTQLTIGAYRDGSGYLGRCFKGTISDLVIKVER